MSVVSFNTARKKAGLPLVRFDLRRYSDTDIADLREAFEAYYAISNASASDTRGYWAVARGHGYDQYLCHTSTAKFLTWHRSYVYAFEKGLSAAFAVARGDMSLVITMPYWDWTTTDPSTDAPNGIPKALNDDTYVDRNGQTKPNPLRSAKSLYRIDALGLTGAQEYTDRYPDRLRAAIPVLAREINNYMTNLSDYATFNSTFDNGAHGQVHVYTGGSNSASPLPNKIGDMSAVVSAAFDPIFWFHHTMVDYVWYNWQKKYGNSTVPDSVRTEVLYNGLTGEQTLYPETVLKYIYGIAPPALTTFKDALSKTNNVKGKLRAESLAVKASNITPNIQKAKLEFQGMSHPKGSYEVRAFVDLDNADANTPIENNPNYAGALHFFGHGECTGAEGHCDPKLAVRDAYDLRPSHPLEKRNFSLDVTEAVKAVARKKKGSGPSRMNIHLVVLDAGGNQVAPEEFDFDHLVLLTY